MSLKNFCYLPFNSVSMDSRGGLRPCCNAYEINYGEIKNYDYNSIMNNEHILSLRRSFLKDERHEDCNRCWKLEDNNIKSYREVFLDIFKKDNPKDINYYLKEQISYDDIEYFDITLSNKCNLACRMCNLYSSSLYAKNLIDLKIYEDKSGNNGLINHSSDDEEKILHLVANAKNLNRIYFIGGEPLVNEFHDRVLDVLIKNGRAKDILLQYNTNMQVDIKRYLEIWKSFRYITLNASIDGTGSIYEYIRWPGKFNKVYENLKLAIEYKNTINKMTVGLSLVNQNLNAENMTDFLEKFVTIGIDDIWWITVTGGLYLNMTPSYILENELEKIKKVANISPYKDKGRLNMDNLIGIYEQSINTPNEDYAEYIKFFNLMKNFDLYRKQNLFNTVPWMKEVADKHHIESW